jgi:peptidoglycan/LPS O-acetylase OafA/YrhL
VNAAVDPPPLSIPPPPAVRAAAWVAVLQAVLVVVVAVVVVLAREDADLTWALATASYFVVLALLIAAVGRGLLQGRRWARTPAIVIELIFALVGFYLAVPSGQLLPGLVLIGIGVAALALLLSRAANDWIRRFPSLFGPAPDR